MCLRKSESPKITCARHLLLQSGTFDGHAIVLIKGIVEENAIV